MKKLYIISTLAACILILGISCEKVLDVYPVLEISDETALSTEEGLQTALIGAYDRLQSGYLYGGRIWVGGDMLADNVKKSGDYALVYEEIQMMEKNMSPDNLITSVLWSDGYYAINLVNRVLQAIPDVFGDQMNDSRKRISGECLFIRSMLYFDLMRYLGNPNNGLGVPLVLEPLPIDAQPARAPMEDIYTQIINDLITAIGYLPESNNNRATKYAAEALLSRIYFYHGDYQQAADAATNVINSGKFSLVEDVMANYQDMTLTDEMIFVMISTQLDASCGTLNGYFRKASTPRFSPSNDLLKIFLFTGGLDDARYVNWFKEIGGKVYTTKFDNRYMHVPLMRLAELYLTRAESRHHLSDGTGALQDLNMVRMRAGLDSLTVYNPNTFLNTVYYERAKELVFEGDSFFNMKRLQKEEISYLDLPWNSTRLLYKVPQREIDVNPNLVQN